MRTERAWQWVMYLGVALALGSLLVWATQGAIARNPAPDATTELGPYGLVTIRFSTAPNPALPTGQVMLSFMPMDARGLPVALDGMKFEYGREGSDQAVGVGQAQLMSDGSGMFLGSAQFPTVGRWWIRARLYKGAAQSAVRFTLEVKPAQ